LKNIKGPTWEDAFALIRMMLGRLFRHHEAIFTSQSEPVRRRFEALADETADPSVMRSSLDELTTALHQHYGVPAVLLIDEYDSPAIEAFNRGYLDEMIDFLRAWLGSGLKHENGPALFRAVVTGILRIAKESIFSGLNNLKVATTLDLESWPKSLLCGMLSSPNMAGRVISAC